MSPPDAPQVLVWSKQRRSPRRQAPSVDRIVQAAVAIADAEGLPAVSMRRVASDLGSGTASLYRYIDSRDDLVALMIDAVHGETEAPALTGDWRADIIAVAHFMRDVLLRHPWTGPERIGRPGLGPNALLLHDTALGAASELTPDITIASHIVDTVIAYVFGTVARELGEQEAQNRSGLTKDEWRAAIAPYILEVIAGGEYPFFARRVHDATNATPDHRFTSGLAYVLAGIAGTVQDL